MTAAVLKCDTAGVTDQHRRLCPVCKRQALRPRQKTCSAKCRKAHQRQRENIHLHTVDALAAIGAIERIIEDRPDLALAGNDALRTMRERISQALLIRPDFETLGSFEF